MAINRLESQWDIDEDALQPVYLDLIAYRDISNKIASDLDVTHQSPQVLIVKDGKCTYQASHSQIDVEDIKQNI
jgi:bacillithiol system protein YtxJ